MPEYGVLQLGRLALREAIIDTGINNNEVTMSGQDASPDLSVDTVQRLCMAIAASKDAYLPVSFTDKNYLDGWYEITSADGSVIHNRQNPVLCNWQVTGRRVGGFNSVELESRLSGALSRVNNFTVTGERVHAAGVNIQAYNSSTLSPVVVRTGADGAMNVYRTLSLGTYPRWNIASGADALLGRCRVVAADGFEFQGVNVPVATGWTLSNGLVSLGVSTDSFTTGVYSGGAYRADTIKVTKDAASLGSPVQATILRNDLECVVMRLVYSITPGRVQVDIIIRRGSRFIEFVVKATSSGTLKVARTTVAAGTNTSGYVVQTANDGNGNKYIIGSAKTFTADTTTGGVSLASAVQLDAFYGAVIAGSSAVAGDQATNMYAQYVGVASELVRPVMT